MAPLASILARVFCASLPVRLGSVAAILDKWGGVRVVVTTDDRTFAAQLVADRDERAVVVPGYFEPMYIMGDGCRDLDGHARPHWNRNAIIVNRATAELDKTFERNPCGTCRACCITLYVADEGDGFTKPSHTPCRSLCADGCGVYRNRPRTCEAFECVWLKSQRGNRAMPAELRPDRCGAILTDHEAGPTRVHVDQEKPKAWALQQFIETRTEEGDRFEDVTHYLGERR